MRPAAPNAVEAIRKLATRWGDRDIAVSLNRMHCKTGDGETWTTVRVRATRERLGIPEGGHVDDGMISLARPPSDSRSASGRQSGSLIGASYPPHSSCPVQLTPLVPIAALDTPAVRDGALGVIARRSRTFERYQYDTTIRLPGLLTRGCIMKDVVSDRLKLLVFDGSGLVLATKWLEEGGFAWPPFGRGRCA